MLQGFQDTMLVDTNWYNSQRGRADGVLFGRQKDARFVSDGYTQLGENPLAFQAFTVLVNQYFPASTTDFSVFKNLNTKTNKLTISISLKPGFLHGPVCSIDYTLAHHEVEKISESMEDESRITYWIQKKKAGTFRCGDGYLNGVLEIEKAGIEQCKVWFSSSVDQVVHEY